MSGKRKEITLLVWILAAVLMLSALPGAAYAQSNGVLQPVTSAQALVSGSYVLTVDGCAMGALGGEGFLPAAIPLPAGEISAAPDLLWVISVSESGICLTDPMGNLFLPEAEWSAEWTGGGCRFLAATPEGSRILGKSGALFTLAEDATGLLTEFSLFRLTEEAPSPGETPDDETQTPPVLPEPEAEEESPVPGLYFGLLHGHTSFSDGADTPQAVYAAGAAGMDFLGLTEHSDSLTDEEWAEGAAAAEAATTEAFAALWGYEISWGEAMHLGHISAFGTTDFPSWQEEAYKNYAGGLENYYAALAWQTGAVGQFHHPGSFYGNFKNFTYDARADKVISLLEVFCEGEDYSDAYLTALDKGWHVSPTFGGETHAADPGAFTGRTVVRLDALTQETLMDALKNRRTYATQDADLHILWTLDGCEMGEILKSRHTGPTAEFDITLYDPTDTEIGTVEILTPGGAVAARIPTVSNPDRITLSLPADKAYYFLRVTQTDGDVALTAPVWVEQEEQAGISEVTCAPAVPVQGEDITLTLKLFNAEPDPLEVQKITLLLDGEEIKIWQDAFSVTEQAEKALTYTHEKLGEGTLTLRVDATLDGQPRSYETSLILSARRSDLVTGILVDGTHGNAGLDSLQELTAMAAAKNIQLTIARETITEEQLGQYAMLVIASPEADFSPEFLEIVQEYVACGGNLLVCAHDPARAGELNRLLATVGATAQFTGELNRHRPKEFNRAELLCAGINENQLYYLEQGCAVAPGSGTWLVRGQEIVMVREQVGGTVLVCGSLLTEDKALQVPEYLWEEPYANRTIVSALLGDVSEPLALSEIRSVRQGIPGEIYRIRGYVTASTFPGELMVQDKTGGIGILPLQSTAPGLGRAVEITGTLQWYGENPVLEPITVECLSLSGHRYQPEKLTCRKAQEADRYSGLLVQVAGICTDRTLTADGRVKQFVLRDGSGRKLTVVVGDSIVSGTTGKNDLHNLVEEDKEIWAMGILQTADNGVTYLRVRNCDEVVEVEPIPYTGDSLQLWLTALLLSAAALLLLRRRNIRP